MISRLNLENILFLDIETVPQHEHFSDLDSEMQKLYADKTEYQRRDEFTAEEFYERAGIWAEFGKIVCISVGYFKLDSDTRNFRTTTFSGTEKELLFQFKKLLSEHYNKPQHVLCAHNGKEFDFPFIARRMIVNGIKLPFKLDLFGKKPWEIPHLDTLELWKFGDYKHYTSLKLLTKILDIPSPKTDIDGSQVRDVYYKQKDVKRIVEYCERDVVAVAQIVLRLRNEALLEDSEVTSV
ncbi:MULTISPECIES: 3'-5' exonuclease [unclassified Leeuwenhoekiella]|uniref:3'-5' exonuclease n=1 Tax=unclassified Leeuwenhoekiella TaxID=2615029 RepID=UPI000C505609|nr:MULTISPECIES: 3'-5' exonuclease [unclassified Leeuwenhoekiella]MAW96069.1 3'-5' exonuclease [Leeuwenhoekiella sp.]MBA80063.1 3'-5' exonuclease [Leeuwenhoekiella sp.]|tara:strand:- start:14961 stop:15674 length:714 start_codon:yes stop_codon:yes gene_type:complete